MQPQLRVPQHRARGEPVRPAGIRQHLHPPDEPHDRRARTSGWRPSTAAPAGLAFASGQAAITAALLTIVHAGQNFISATSLYGGTWTLFTQTFSKLGIEVRFFDPSKPETLSKLVDENTRAVYIETPGNPKNDVPDYKKLTDIAHSHGLPAIIDNTVLTPALFRPIEHGFDIVVYSTTKFIGGHGVHSAGRLSIAASSSGPRNRRSGRNSPRPTRPITASFSRRRCGRSAISPTSSTSAPTGCATRAATQSPFGAFLTLLGLETLHLRLERHSQNALAVAQFLEKHPAVLWVNYPGLPSHPDHASAKKYLPDGQGAIMGFGIKGGKEAGAKLIDSVKLFSHLANIGDAKSLIIHPATTTHSQLTPEEQAQTGVTPEFVRLSVGIEDVRDIIADLDQALAASQ